MWYVLTSHITYTKCYMLWYFSNHGIKCFLQASPQLSPIRYCTFICSGGMRMGIVIRILTIKLPFHCVQIGLLHSLFSYTRLIFNRDDIRKWQIILICQHHQSVSLKSTIYSHTTLSPWQTIIINKQEDWNYSLSTESWILQGLWLVEEDRSN